MIRNIDNIITQIERLMYGINFEVCIGIDVFTGCTTTDFEKAIKVKYPGTNPVLYPLMPFPNDALLEDIMVKLDFRGDNMAGLTLTEEKENALKALQQQYLDHIRQFINDQTKSFCYADPEGIPGYPVFWEYRYVLFTDNNKIILIYGAASD